MRLKLLASLILTSTIWLVPGGATAQSSFSVDSFNGDYYLDANPDGVSVLTAEEVILANFGPNSSQSGIVRSIPTKYQGHDIALKIISISDVSGKPASYRTSIDEQNNLVIKIGDPAITVLGQQSYDIKYQSKGAINFLSDKDEFLPNFNGRGWDQEFGLVIGAIHLPDKLYDRLLAKPQCAVDSGKCSINIDKKAGETVITAKSLNSLPAHQSLTAKLDFKKGTFKQIKPPSKLKSAGILAGAIVGLLAIAKSIGVAINIIWKRPKSPKAS